MPGGDRARAIATTLALSLLATAARAQDEASPRVRWERPPEGTIERGLHGVPGWVVIVLGALVVAASAAALVAALRRSRRGAR